MFRSITSLLLVFLLSCLALPGQQPLLVNSYNRAALSLDGPWNYIVDPYENGFYNYRYQPFENSETPSKSAFFMDAKPANKSDLLEYDFDQSDTISVPGDWNTQKERLYYYEGTVWYRKTFAYRKSAEENRVFIQFGAVNYRADVYFNGKKLGKHLGGFTPFQYEVTDWIREESNSLVVKVDNKRLKEGVPTLNTDWWNYGGITRSVKVVETPPTYIEDYLLQLNPENYQQITGHVQLNGPGRSRQKVRIRIPDLKIEAMVETNDEGRAALTLEASIIEYWSPEAPRRYEVTLHTSTESLTDQIGFRTIRTEGQNILLNDTPIFLKGISIHEESPVRGGRAHSREDAQQLLTWAQELGCNYVRLAHYPHNEHMVRLADEMGILVWEEIPVYWTIDWENPATYDNAQNQLTEVIQRDKNRASVIIWSMANETPTSEARNRFLNRLATHTRSLDPTRLISAALEQTNYQGDPNVRTIHDAFAEVADVLSFNQYIGWYDGLPDKCKTVTWKITQDKPVIISEFGGGAKFGVHGDKDTRWTEEFQEYLYQETLAMLDKLPQLRGISPWILVDFRSPRRPLPGIQDGWNRKGVLSEKGEKKKAFFVLREYYSRKKVPGK